DWVPVFAELVSNGGDGSDHGVAPRMRHSMPNGPRIVAGEDPPACRPSDLEVNSMVVTTGELLKDQVSDPVYNLQRLYRDLDLEIFYFNNTTDSSQNCDRSGPQLGPGPFSGEYHEISATTVEWAVPANDEAGVWRVIVVYDDGTVDSQGRGRWQPLELMDDGGIWRGSVSVPGPLRLPYILQAAARRGNVNWLEYRTTEPEGPASGVSLGLPDTMDVDIPLGTTDLGLTVSDTPDPVQTESLLTYTILVHNYGPDPASSVVVSDLLPTGVSFVGTLGDGWSCSESDGLVSCDRDFLGAGDTAPAITVLLTSPPGPGAIINAVSVEALEDDPNAGNDAVSEPTEVVGDPPPVDGLQIIHSPSPFGYVSLASLGVTPFDCPTAACDETGWVIE
ncbi:MAG: DUF11 domain-containing protein, partial [bacterium]|nr:DUF11 domain-containing protein [bacterium]